MTTILIVEDEAPIREVLAETLRDEGYAVFVASNGAAALVIVAERRPDLVLTDVMMPGLDGLGLLRRLRADSGTAAIPVVVTSAAQHPSPGDLDGAKFLPKPYDLDDLLRAVRDGLRG